MSKEVQEAFGRPITGDIPRYSEGMSEQDDPQKFLDALDTLLNIEGVFAVRWREYTPYFNDGDPCTFSAYVDGVIMEEGGDSIELYSLEDGPIKTALRTFEKVVESGRHHAMLNSTFGDPAEVTATKAGFEVEFYDHE